MRILALVLLISACGATTLISPDDYGSKQDLYKEEVDFTVYTNVGHKLVDVAVVGDFLSEHGIEQAKQIIREETTRCAKCLQYYMVDRGDMMVGPVLYYRDMLKDYKIIIVPDTFKCLSGEKRTCHGFWSPNPKMIVLAWDRPATEENLALYCHELAHRSGKYRTDHEDLKDEVLECIKYE